jgi:hypothetical protein
MPSGKDGSPQMPDVVVHSYSRLGYLPLPSWLNDPMQCLMVVNAPRPVVPSPPEDDTDDGKEPLVEVECTTQSRYCSMYGVNAVVCICDANPPSKINLDVVREYCYFATKDVSQMDNGLKRNMLYWWYMTNHYNICGKGNREEPPACLKAAIRKAYPESSGRYVKYQSKK